MKRTKHDFDVSTADGQKRLMAESMGLPSDAYLSKPVRAARPAETVWPPPYVSDKHPLVGQRIRAEDVFTTQQGCNGVTEGEVIAVSKVSFSERLRLSILRDDGTTQRCYTNDPNWLVKVVSAHAGARKVGAHCPPLFGAVAQAVLLHRAQHARELAADPRRAHHVNDCAYRRRYAQVCEYFAGRAELASTLQQGDKHRHEEPAPRRGRTLPVSVTELAHIDGNGVGTFTVRASNGDTWRVTPKGADAQRFNTAMADGTTISVDDPAEWSIPQLPLPEEPAPRRGMRL